MYIRSVSRVRLFATPDVYSQYIFTEYLLCARKYSRYQSQIKIFESIKKSKIKLSRPQQLNGKCIIKLVAYKKKKNRLPVFGKYSFFVNNQRNAR